MNKIVTSDGAPGEPRLSEDESSDSTTVHPIVSQPPQVNEAAIFDAEWTLTGAHEAAQDARRRAGLRLLSDIGLNPDEPFSNQDIQNSVDLFLLGQTPGTALHATRRKHDVKDANNTEDVDDVSDLKDVEDAA